MAPPGVLACAHSALSLVPRVPALVDVDSPVHENAGFMAYNVLAGGVLTGKYLERPAAVDETSREAMRKGLEVYALFNDITSRGIYPRHAERLEALTT